MKTAVVSCLLLLCSVGYSQNARVVQLTPSESAEAGSILIQQDELQKKLFSLEQRIREAHAQKDSWVLDTPWEYTPDYKMIVPKPYLTLGPLATPSPRLSPAFYKTKVSEIPEITQ